MVDSNMVKMDVLLPKSLMDPPIMDHTYQIFIYLLGLFLVSGNRLTDILSKNVLNTGSESLHRVILLRPYFNNCRGY